MKLSKVLKSITFRYIAIYVSVLSVGVFVLMLGLYALFSWGYFTTLRDAILDELDTVELIFNGQGVEGVQQYIEDQTSSRLWSQYSYLLLDADGEKVAGNLNEAPTEYQFGEDWISFELGALYLGEEVDIDFLARAAPLPEGYQIIVALSYVEAVEGSKLVFQVLFQAMIATVLLGMVGGYISAAGTLRRVEDLNQHITRIIHGNLSERLPVASQEGNMRELAQNVNDMLDNTQSLMQGVRTVSDNIAHDLRTPLTRLRNGLEGLRGEDLAEDDRPVQDLVDECDELLDTFNALLRISKLEAGSVYQGNARVDVESLLHDALEFYEPLASEKQQQLALRGEGGYCRGDVDLLFQLFANVIDNAVKYAPRGGRVQLSLDSENGGVRVVVADNGPGIPRADRQNVFRRFFRLESSREAHAGNGLGLSLVRAIVLYHGGTVELTDNGPGLRVSIFLPGEVTPDSES